MASKIGLIGLDTMGKPTAVNIARAGFELTLYDLREERSNELGSLGPTVAASARKVVEQRDIIEIVVVDDDHPERVVAGEHGVIHGARPGAEAPKT